MDTQEVFELKRISPDEIPDAIAKAQRYRRQNDSAFAVTICREVLAVDPGNQLNLRTLILALCDQFASPGSRATARTALGYVALLESPYDRAYHAGVVAESEGRACLTHTRRDAYDGIRRAISWYARADAMVPSGRTDARLRYNACVRTLEVEALEPPRWEPELPLE